MEIAFGVCCGEEASTSLVKKDHVEGVTAFAKMAPEEIIHYEMTSILPFRAGYRGVLSWKVRADVKGQLISKPYKDNSIVDTLYEGNMTSF